MNNSLAVIGIVNSGLLLIFYTNQFKEYLDHKAYFLSCINAFAFLAMISDIFLFYRALV